MIDEWVILEGGRRINPVAWWDSGVLCVPLDFLGVIHLEIPVNPTLALGIVVGVHFVTVGFRLSLAEKPLLVGIAVIGEVPVQGRLFALIGGGCPGTRHTGTKVAAPMRLFVPAIVVSPAHCVPTVFVPPRRRVSVAVKA